MNQDLENIKIIINNLLDAREFFSYQYSSAIGLMEDLEYDKLEDEFYNKISKESDEDLLPKAKLLFSLLNENITTDIIEACLNCDVFQAERIKDKIYNSNKEEL